MPIDVRTEIDDRAPPGRGRGCAADPDNATVMSTAEGPSPMKTTYTWEEAGSGATRMTLRHRREPAGLATVTAPVLARAMRRANAKDLARLKTILTPGA